MTPATARPKPPLPREQVPIADRVAYLDTAYMSPTPTSVAEAMAADARRSGAEGSLGEAAREEVREDVRHRTAAVLGSDPDDVAFVATTTQGMGLVAAGLDWRAGDQVLVAQGDHPSVVLPFRARTDLGVEVVEVPTGPGAVLERTDVEAALVEGGGRVRVVALSWVRADRGWRTDLSALASLAHAHGALLCVDLIQGLGAIPCALREWGVDAAAAGAQKWLLGPHGVGVAHLAPELRERLRVLAPSQEAVADGGAAPGPLAFRTTARRHESGATNHIGVAGLGAALDLLVAAGPGPVWAQVDHLAARLADGLRALGAEVLTVRDAGAGAGSGSGSGSGIVSATLDGLDAAAAVERLGRAGVVAAARADGVRFSPHAWNDDTDVDAAVAAVAAL